MHGRNGRCLCRGRVPSLTPEPRPGSSRPGRRCAVPSGVVGVLGIGGRGTALLPGVTVEEKERVAASVDVNGPAAPSPTALTHLSDVSPCQSLWEPEWSYFQVSESYLRKIPSVSLVQSSSPDLSG